VTRTDRGVVRESTGLISALPDRLAETKIRPQWRRRRQGRDGIGSVDENGFVDRAIVSLAEGAIQLGFSITENIVDRAWVDDVVRSVKVQEGHVPMVPLDSGGAVDPRSSRARSWYLRGHVRRGTLSATLAVLTTEP
jgi:hypothetical protein